MNRRIKIDYDYKDNHKTWAAPEFDDIYFAGLPTEFDEIDYLQKSMIDAIRNLTNRKCAYCPFRRTLWETF